MQNITRKPASPNHYRDRIISEGLLKYIDVVSISDRNRQVVKLYVCEGKSYGYIAEKFEISNTRIPQIIHNFILHCVRIQSNNE